MIAQRIIDRFEYREQKGEFLSRKELQSYLLAKQVVLLEELVYKQRPKKKIIAADTPFINCPISDLELTVRSINSLKGGGVHYIRDLIQKNRKELLEFTNFGKKCLYEVEETLDNYALTLGMEIVEN